MKIKRLVIENFKSIERIELIEPNPFTVFVGPNGSGKSNIFEALEFVNSFTRVYPRESIRQFGGAERMANRKKDSRQLFKFEAEFDRHPISAHIKCNFFNDPEILPEYQGIPNGRERGDQYHSITHQTESGNLEISASEQFFLRFCRVFSNNTELLKFAYQDDISLNLAATNLETVLKRVLKDEVIRREILEWLELFIPEFRTLEIISNQLDGKDTLLWYERYSESPFTKNLISDGTFNILALLTAVYQSDDKPQFLCIEEPENGLHPQVARELVDFFRIMCEERGHYIWLNTHSQSMASRVRAEELVIVEKKQGATQIRQFADKDFYGMRADEAWLTNSLGGGLAW